MTLVSVGLGWSLSIYPAEARAPLEAIRGVWKQEEINDWQTPQAYLFWTLWYEGRIEAWPVLWAVAECESRWKTNAYNSKTKDSGIFQVHIPIHGQNRAYWENAKNNIDYALKLFKRNGLRDWSASQKCWSNI